MSADILLEPDIYKEGDKIVDQIITLFSIRPIKPRPEIARPLAIRYANYLRTIVIEDQMAHMIDGSLTWPYENAMWSRSISEARTGNWETISTKIRTTGEDIFDGAGYHIQDQRFGNSLINLSESLL